MKKKVKDCTKKEIYKAIYDEEQTTIAEQNCKFCIHYSFGCEFQCVENFNCIDFEEIKRLVGEEEIEVEDNEI